MTVLMTLSNHIKLLIKRKEDIHTVNARLVVKTGMLYETDNQNGLSHFLEHMLFKGTKSRNSKELLEFIEQRGGNTNAYTTEDTTCYGVNVPIKYWKEACEFLADISQNSIFPEEELEKEREVIIQEYKERNADPNYQAYYSLVKTGFNKRNMSRQVLGTLDNIKRFTRKDLIKYYEKHYIPEKMIMAITVPSSIDNEEIRDYIESLFSNLNYGTQYVEIYQKDEIDHNKINIEYKPGIEQSYMLLGMKGIPLDSNLKPAFDVFLNILDGGMSARLFQLLREKLGLTYSVYSFYYNSIVSDIFGIGTILEEKNENLAIEEIKKLLVDMSNNITDKEVEKAKNTIEYEFAKMEDTNSIGNDIHSLIYMNKLFDFDEELDKLRNVTKNDIYQVIKELLKNEFTISIIRPERNN